MTDGLSAVASEHFSGEARYIEREESWLAFNERVLELAENTEIPLLERAKFLAIFASNLDEFFMVRVAGIKRRVATGLALTTPTGHQPREVLELISAESRSLMARQSACFHEVVKPQLAEQGIFLLSFADLDDDERQYLREIFINRIFPVLTPLAVDPTQPFPYISGLSLNLAVVVGHPATGEEVFARVKVPPSLPRFLPTKAIFATRYIPLEDLIAAHLDELFPGMEVLKHYAFRVTRNQDLEVEEDEAENLLNALEQELLRRRFGPPVRLEVDENMDPILLSRLLSELEIIESEVFRLAPPLDLTGLNRIADLDRPELKFVHFAPATHPSIAAPEFDGDIFAAIRDKDILLHHPYDSFTTSVVAFLDQAADDPAVLAIKQTLYRTSGDSPIVDALIAAAEAGKQVLALIELRARFDELANVRWARKLEEAGVHVLYGLLGLKTHAKLSLVVRDEADGLRRYCHIGTGNYNPKTARHYEDLGILTCDPHLGEDLTRLFNQLSGFAPQTEFRRLLVAPTSMRAGLFERIEREIGHVKAGRTAKIRLKLNSLEDEAMIEALYAASAAGVVIQLVIRGICALRPGVIGLSENITVNSYLGRFLEHSRIFHFSNGGDDEIWIGSADMMHRNLDRRVEALVKITDPDSREILLGMLDELVTDHFASWHLHGDTTWSRIDHDADGQELPDWQDVLIHRYQKRDTSL
ncbi:MAG TPA: RNA degradosome polyphosphate kinase [Candidatus Nanopelagicaceae bacterium]|nr:RNA degradosome polyphosphate kinase [Candidatus Nanopelagicaceae bacterium]